MAAYLGNDATSFNGLELNHARPRARVQNDDVADILEDQAFIRQLLTNKQLDESTAYSGDEQRHDGTNGCLLGWPLASVSTCNSNSDATVDGYSNTHSPTIIPTGISSSARFNVYYIPAFIPTGTERVLIHVRASANFNDLKPAIKKYTVSSGSTPSIVAEGNEIPSHYTPTWEGFVDSHSAVNDFVFSVDVDNSGEVYVFLLTCVAEADFAPANIYSVRVLPELWRKVSGQMPPQEVNNPSGVVTPLVGSSFAPIYDTMAAANKPLCSYLTGRAAENDGMLHEIITGTKAPGASSATHDGHNHDGTIDGGPKIDMPLLAVCLGWADDASGGLIDGTEGKYGSAPHIDDATEGNTTPATPDWYQVQQGFIEIPDRDSETTVNVGVLVFDGEENKMAVKVETATSLGGSYTTTRLPSGTGTVVTGTQYIAGTCGVAANFTNNVMYYRIFIAQFQDKETSASDICEALLGYCFWLEAA